MRLITALGSEEFFLFIMPAVYWCVDASLGLRVATLLISSNSLNELLKLAFHLPRPFWVDERVRALSVETTYGLPSGHAQTATAVWGGLATQIKQRWVWAVIVVLVILISFSRLYLGVHFLGDVVAGWVIGGLLVWVFARWGSAWVSRLKGLSLGIQIALALGVALIYLALCYAAITLAPPDPPQWAGTVSRVLPGEEFNPRNPETPVSAAGLIFGLGLSLALLARGPHFRADGPFSKRALRFAVGVLGVLVFWLGLRVIFPSGTDIIALFFRFTRYTLIVVWALYLAPLVFLEFKLATPQT
jgi:hypothetical protein